MATYGIHDLGYMFINKNPGESFDFTEVYVENLTPWKINTIIQVRNCFDDMEFNHYEKLEMPDNFTIYSSDYSEYINCLFTYAIIPDDLEKDGWIYYDYDHSDDGFYSDNLFYNYLNYEPILKEEFDPGSYDIAILSPYSIFRYKVGIYKTSDCENRIDEFETYDIIDSTHGTKYMTRLKFSSDDNSYLCAYSIKDNEFSDVFIMTTFDDVDPDIYEQESLPCEFIHLFGTSQGGQNDNKILLSKSPAYIEIRNMFSDDEIDIYLSDGTYESSPNIVYLGTYKEFSTFVNISELTYLLIRNTNYNDSFVYYSTDENIQLPRIILENDLPIIKILNLSEGTWTLYFNFSLWISPAFATEHPDGGIYYDENFKMIANRIYGNIYNATVYVGIDSPFIGVFMMMYRFHNLPYIPSFLRDYSDYIPIKIMRVDTTNGFIEHNPDFVTLEKISSSILSGSDINYFGNSNFIGISIFMLVLFMIMII
jgi:hypothetical protein